MDSRADRAYSIQRDRGVKAFTLADLQAFVRSAERAGLAPTSLVFGAIEHRRDLVHLTALSVKETPNTREAFWESVDNRTAVMSEPTFQPATAFEVVGALDFNPAEAGEVRGEVTDDDPVFDKPKPAWASHTRRRPAAVQDGTAVPTPEDDVALEALDEAYDIERAAMSDHPDTPER